MKVRIEKTGYVFMLMLFASATIISCSDSNDDPSDPQIENSIDDDTIDDVGDDVSTITEEDQDALLFMLEEEKLARDTYKFLNDYWGMVQFANIMQSEQSHMNAVETLLDAYDIEYEILEDGVFNNEALQAWYDQFVQDGIVDEVAALNVGATIEDLDIVDLEEHIQATTNSDIADVFLSLQCGSRNHLRSFVQSIENLGETYTPQFLAQEEYETILEGSREQCN
ncbi:DUF2202 domain-containing protein [Flagellimonas okinawensis]|uniref:DUF2202 domain-containing protein n=1 Tax=Flagellimonas okinawensis TaxID=3031324 RepID=A0ABT5XPQ0_9FLAO|nr:DUF2202 domain-containing protein [[Muricauda] okinawensis]MDF0707864.1 DUF2202 domain-containing protein [[Muricauda] okinawensis]